MKLNLSIRVNDMRGKVSDVTLAQLLGSVMFSVSSNEHINISADEKYTAYTLYKRLLKSAEIDATVEELAFVKRVAAASLAAGTYGQLIDAIENREV
jgi:ATP-dependent exoDNAse (exonuclease V) beta subunit